MIRALVVAAVGVTLLCAQTASAQLTTLAIGGCSCNMGNTTVAEYVAGTKVSSAVTYTVTNVLTAPSRTTSVYIHANAAAMNNGKAVGECEWRRSDLATWNAITTSDALIESRVIAGSGTSWNNSVVLRCSLDWVNDPVAAQSVGLTFTLKVTP